MNSHKNSGGASSLVAAMALTLTIQFAVPAQAQSQSTKCAEDDTGITLSPGFCATVFADKLGHVRHLTVAPNGVVYANTWSGRYFRNDTPPPGGFLIALRSTKGDGKADDIVRFGPAQSDGNAGGSGIAVYKGYVYAETNDRIVRYALPASGIAPTGAAETVVSGLPLTGDHPMHPIQIDKLGNLFVDVGTATNSCQSQNRVPNVAGNAPCTELETRGGTWRYDANKLDQHFSPAERFATGLRNGEGFGFDSAGRMFATQHGRDQLAENFPSLYTPMQGATQPAEELVQLSRGADFGWPECYFDYDQNKLVLAPEYGGDGGKKIGICAQKQAPVAAFPAHWAPNDMLIYEGNQFPSAYKDGAFIAFHGSWNRAPAPQGGYNVVFQRLAGGKASGPFVVFADGFAGARKEPGRALYRPGGLAVGPDGALYIAEDQRGRIWRVTWQGGKTTGLASAAPTPPVVAVEAPNLGALPIPPGGSPDQVAMGDQIFHGQVHGGTCAGCHSGDAKGSAVGSDLTSGRYLWGDGSVKAIAHTIETGLPKGKEHSGAMPPKGGADLSAEDVAALADYVWAIGHKNGP